VLLEALLAVPGLGRVRLSSLEPMEVRGDLLALMAAEPRRLCPHLHLPLQSGDDAVLRRMNRPYGAGEFLGQVAAIRQALDRPAITTDILVGFPGETPAAFENTLRAMTEARFSRVHVFPFSPRPGTPAAAMPDRVPRGTVKERRRRAAALGEALAREYRESLIGREAEVVVERVTADGGAEGLSERYVRVRIAPPLGANLARRALLAVRIVRAAGDWLEAAPEA
jgi:threonylcarbamoyladenosine tRNA methylthiotransferase MtaB